MVRLALQTATPVRCTPAPPTTSQPLPAGTYQPLIHLLVTQQPGHAPAPPTEQELPTSMTPLAVEVR
jgi:hypothetical protein